MRDTLREKALRLLGRREQTRHELLSKLAPLAESATQLESLLNELTTSGLLSDARYVQTRVSARAARLGDARLAYELRSKGVAEDLVGAALAAGEDELTRAGRVWQRRFAGRPTADAAERARQMRFLAGRGFSADTIRRLLRTPLEDD